MSAPIKIAVAAKWRHAPKIAEAFAKAEGFHLNSRWVERAIADPERKRPKPVPHWEAENFDDIATGHAFVLYLEPGDELEGAVWEAGHASGIGKKIWIAGDGYGVEVEVEPGVMVRLPHRGIIPWGLYRQQVRIVSSLEAAFTAIQRETIPSTFIRTDGSSFTEKSVDIFSPATV